MLLQYAIIVGIVYAASAGPCSSIATFTDKDCVGHDIAPSGSSGLAVANFEACRLGCHSNIGCTSFEFDYTNSKCYYKNFKCTAATMTASTFPAGQLAYAVCGTGVCQGVTTYPEKDCVGHDLDGKYAMDAATSADCHAICSSDMSCRSYEYNNGTHKCYPKNYQCTGAEITASTYPAGQLTYFVCSGLGSCPGVNTYTDKDCVGHDLATSSGTSAANEAICQSVCSSYPSCVAFVYAFSTKKCYPKDYKCSGTEITASAFPAGAVSYYACT